MAVQKFVIVFLASLIALSTAAPTFFGHKHHEHVVVHVPYNIHTVHHHHIKAVPIVKHVPIIKHVPVYKEVEVIKEVHVPVHHHLEHHVPEYKEWSSSGWW